MPLRFSCRRRYAGAYASAQGVVQIHHQLSNASMQVYDTKVLQNGGCHSCTLLGAKNDMVQLEMALTTPIVTTFAVCVAQFCMSNETTIHQADVEVHKKNNAAVPRKQNL